ncbi:MAG: GNAT family N-acetyltransferase [Oscillospiraceae bacterium]
MILKTKRLILRPWDEADAESLYEFAKDPLVGPAAGWPAHTSLEDSRHILREVLSAEGTYAVALKDDKKANGCVGLKVGAQSSLAAGDQEAEIGYWLGVPYWGRGLIPEAVTELIRYAFEETDITTIWCAFFEGNEKSKRVQEKCGFQYHHTNQNRACPLLGSVRTEHVSCITKDQWHKQ